MVSRNLWIPLRFPLLPNFPGLRLNSTTPTLTVAPWLADIRYTLKRRCNHKYPDLWKAVLESQRVNEAIGEELSLSEQEAASRGGLVKNKCVRRKNLITRAKKYLLDMRATVSVPIIRCCGWLFFKVFGRLFSGILVCQKQLDELQLIAKKRVPIVYLPQHRSHLDYLLITFILWHWDIRIPHVAAGDNLNLSGFGWLLKCVGAFFIRRRLDENSNRKDYIYRAVLQTYMTELLKSGEQIEIFVEGGRSRSGKPLLPKSGLLSVIIDACVQGVIEDAYVVSVSHSYEKLLEGGFTSELLGAEKEKESFWMIIRSIFQALGNCYGYVRVDFGPPISLKELLSALGSTRDSGDFLFGITTGGYNFQSGDSLFASQGRLMPGSSNFLQPTTPPADNPLDNRLLIKAVCEHMIFAKEVIARKRDIVGFDPFDDRCFVPDIVLRAAHLLGIESFSPISGTWEQRNVQLIPSNRIENRLLLCYYKNGLLSAFAVDCVIATAVLCFDLKRQFLEDELIEICLSLCNLLEFEFLFFRVVNYDTAYAVAVLKFYKNLLFPILNAYYWMAVKLNMLLDLGSVEEEGANTESFKNALRVFLERKVIRRSSGEKNMVFLDPEYSEKSKLEEHSLEIKMFL